MKNKPDFDNRTGTGAGVKSNYREADRQAMLKTEKEIEKKAYLKPSTSNYLDDIESQAITKLNQI